MRPRTPRAAAAASLAVALAAAPAAAAPPPREIIPQAAAPRRAVAPTTAYDDARSFDKSWATRFYAYDVAGFLAQAATADLVVAPPDRNGRLSPLTLPRDPSCGCEFKVDGSLADPTHCEGMRGVVDVSAARERALSVVDPRRIAAPLACFRKGSCEIDGVEFGGLTCCDRQDSGYAAAARDSHFYVLAPQPLVDAVAGLVPGAAAPGSPTTCGFAIDRERGVFSLPRSLDGVVARAWLYASRHYGTTPPAAIDALALLSSRSPADRFEVARERLTRARFGAPMNTLDGVLRASQPSVGLRSLGVVE